MNKQMAYEQSKAIADSMPFSGHPSAVIPAEQKHRASKASSSKDAKPPIDDSPSEQWLSRWEPYFVFCQRTPLFVLSKTKNRFSIF